MTDAVIAMLAPLDPETRARIVGTLVARYAPAIRHRIKGVSQTSMAVAAVVRAAGGRCTVADIIADLGVSRSRAFAMASRATRTGHIVRLGRCTYGLPD